MSITGRAQKNIGENSFSDALKCQMKFGAYLPDGHDQGPLPVLFYLSGKHFMQCDSLSFRANMLRGQLYREERLPTVRIGRESHRYQSRHFSQVRFLKSLKDQRLEA